MNTEFFNALELLQKEIDPEMRGNGYGIAPIGHQVTVTGVTEILCNVTMTLSLLNGAERDAILEKIRSSFEDYFVELRKKWADSEYLTVRNSYLEAKVLDVDGVLDVQDCLVNEKSGNLVLGADEIPVLGEIGVNV